MRGRGGIKRNMGKIKKRKSVKKETKVKTFYVVMDEFGKTYADAVFNTKENLLESIGGGAIVYEVKSVKKFKSVDESVRLVEVK